MQTIVQKYGGSSVANDIKLRRVAARLVKLRRQGYDVVAVVSAMGDTTNRLLQLAQDMNDDPPGRELDLLLSSGERISSALLAMTIRAAGVPAVALTGAQAGIRTDDAHLSAQILEVDATRVRQELAAGHVVVVAGFQGSAPGGETTTLGRGGSDTSAVALAAALEVDTCDICSDVDGIYSADPRLVTNATRLDTLHYDEMAALARHGARVLDPRAVACAKRHGVSVHVRSSFQEHAGTLVNSVRHVQPQVIGVASLTRLIKLEFAAPALAHAAIPLCGAEHVYFDDTRRENRSLLISTLNLPQHEHLCKELQQRFQDGIKLTHDVGAVSLVGHGAGRLRPLVEQAPDTPPGLFSSDNAWTCVVREARVPDTMRALHRRFVENTPSVGAAA